MATLSRTAAAVIALSVAAFTLPTSAHAKRMGGSSRSIAPTSIGKAPAKPTAPAAPAAPNAPAAPAAPAAAAAPAPAAAVAPAARGPGMMGTMGAAAVGAVAGSMVGNAMASPNKEVSAKESEAQAAEKEAKELQRKADEAKAKADAARAAAK